MIQNGQGSFASISLLFKLIMYRVFTELRHKVNTFSGKKNYLTELKIKYVKFQNQINV